MTNKKSLLTAIHNSRNLILPLSAVSLIFVMLIPLPSMLLDVLLVANLAFSSLLLLVTIFVSSPLELSSFPSLLLAGTLFRLVLNCATTRKILTAGESPDEMAAAGQMIKAFAEFVAGSNLAVGVIIFLILVVIQFVVITKGATRVSEVAARFTLDGMPGKQMAIDADLNAGLINEAEARRRRESISQEADFYGAMDGASKFVRGDAVAGIIITMINVMGGIAVGKFTYGMDLGQCFSVYTQLTIGDGLVSQIPAFIVSVASALIVTRSTAKGDLGTEIVTQMTSKPKALYVAAGFMAILSFTGLPQMPLLIIGSGFAGVAYVLERSVRRQVAASAAAEKKVASQETKKEKVEDLLPLDRMELEIGYGLIKLVDARQGGDLLKRISMIRKQIAVDMGIIVPSIRIRDNVRLAPNEYSVKLKGVSIAKGEAYPDQYLAMDSGAVSGVLTGKKTVEPAFGLTAYWIPSTRKEHAEMMNYTVVDCSSVLATHLTEVIKNHAAELLSRQDLDELIEKAKEKCPAIVEEVVGKVMRPGEILKVLQSLLLERVPVRDMETILETLGDWGVRTKDIEVLSEYVRNAMARSICNQYCDDQGNLKCVTLDPSLEDVINRHVERTETGSFLTLPPATANEISAAVIKHLSRLTEVGSMPVVLCSPQIRLLLRRMLAPHLANVVVLAYNEIVKGINIQSVSMVVLNSQDPVYN
ncbi:MAG: flagellar biosynthesis protein FlhA [Sedimentisphaerales bacterium]|nr:flagellar biosynthesis protein FlhA [Sedimentisphaerales bacterium]